MLLPPNADILVCLCERGRADKQPVTGDVLADKATAPQPATPVHALKVADAIVPADDVWLGIFPSTADCSSSGHFDHQSACVPQGKLVDLVNSCFFCHHQPLVLLPHSLELRRYTLDSKQEKLT